MSKAFAIAHTELEVPVDASALADLKGTKILRVVPNVVARKSTRTTLLARVRHGWTQSLNRWTGR